MSTIFQLLGYLLTFLRALLLPRARLAARLLAAESQLAVQVVRQGGKIVYKFLGYNPWQKDFFSAWEFIRRTNFA